MSGVSEEAMKQISIRELVRQGNVAKLREWMPCELVADGEIVAMLVPAHDVRQSIKDDKWSDAPLYISQGKATLPGELRDRIFNLLGKKCVWCGYDVRDALQIDHINGGGRKEIASFSSITAYYNHILETKGNGYQILCANCNTLKARGHKAKHDVRQGGELRFSKSTQARGHMR